MRRRRLIALAALALLVAVVGVGLAVAIGGGGPDISRREHTQLENAAPGSSKHPARGLVVPAAVRRAADRLTLPRQVAQLFVVDMEARYPRDPFFSQFRQRGWGGVVLGPDNFVNPGQLAALTGELGVVARQAGIVLPVIAVNQSGGSSSAFPGLPPRAQGAIGRTFRPAVALSQARAAGRALRKLGVNLNLAPVADVGTPAGPVEGQVYGDDAGVVSRMVAAAVRGYRQARIMSAVSHFPGIGAASADPDVATATVGLSLAEMRRRDLRPFAAVARTVPVVIVANAVYAAYDGVTPAVLLPEVVGGLLRRDLGFHGVVMTDDLVSTAPVLGQGVGATAVSALEAGADLLYVSGGGADQKSAYRAVMRAVRSGRVSRARLRLSVLRVLALKRRYGLLPSPRPRPPAAAKRPSRAAPARPRRTAPTRRSRPGARTVTSPRRRASPRRAPPAPVAGPPAPGRP